MDQNRMFTHRVFRNFVLGGSATQMDELLAGVFANSMVADMWRDLDDANDGASCWFGNLRSRARCV